MHRIQADLVYDPRQLIVFSHWFDRYRVEDFADEPEILDSPAFPGSGVFLGCMLRPYIAQTGWLRLMYRL